MTVVSEDVATSEWDRLCEYYKIQTDESRFQGNELEDFNNIKREIIYTIMDGAIKITDEGKCIYLTECGKEFEFRRTTGGDYMVIDKYKDGQDMHKGYAMASTMCNCQPKDISRLFGDDSMFIVKVAGFFMGSRKQRSLRTNR